ncbi:hypothetical protein GXM_10257 [Nostoc sphaeroides CCNUC1]|uniref:Uncharacterized protein n=1 Tax=Nostoc sphaeroides CCNUC1 TaxID=2653204 RepID=A0A5P8WJG4_9NOSO|nr:hypothetical protein GXM_10257 [Nostoc sphaeroides CCNUC1]
MISSSTLILYFPELRNSISFVPGGMGGLGGGGIWDGVGGGGIGGGGGAGIWERFCVRYGVGAVGIFDSDTATVLPNALLKASLSVGNFVVILSYQGDLHCINADSPS